MSYRVVGRPMAVLLITAISLSREIKEPGLDTSCQKTSPALGPDEEGKRRKKKMKSVSPIERPLPRPRWEECIALL